jgi:hypothetical protein
MAIVFDCPHCKTNYRLRDEFGGKTATCKNPNCRKVIPIPMPNGPLRPGDLDAIAAAAFADGPAQQQAVGEMIEVMCLGCDHKWMVEAAKEGKNVLCPECRRPTRVPMRKKQEKADWRTGAGPTLAKRETGLDREGAFGTVGMGGISDQTAREIVKGREAEEEPEERRKKLLKRLAIVVPLILIVAAGAYFAFKSRRGAVADAKMEDAVKELKDATKDGRYNALIHRASGEYRARTSKSADDIKGALTDLQLARNLVKSGGGADKDFILAEGALSQLELMGTTEQMADGSRLKKDEVLKELRLTVTPIGDADLRADLLRAMTRRFAADGQPTLAEEFAHQLPESNELVGQIALELLRIDKERYRSDAESLLKKAGANEKPAVQALRLVLGKSPAGKGDKGEVLTSAIATAEAAALAGEFDKAARVGGKFVERAKALAAAGNVASYTNAAKAAELLKAAASLIKGEARGEVSMGVVVRVCYQLTLLDSADVAESVVASLPDDSSKSWARLGILRGRLGAARGAKAEDSWLDGMSDPAKFPASAKAREEIARYNAAHGHDYQATVKSWPKGTVQPFGTAGLLLGKEDAKK